MHTLETQITPEAAQDVETASLPKDRSAASAAGVSELPERMSDADRETAIKRAGFLVARFHREGRRAKAREALALMHLLIAGRSAEWKAKREAQIQRAIGSPYFISGDAREAANTQ